MESVYVKIYIYFWLVVTGTCFGSFINVVVYRLPNGLFLSKSRSYCPVCEKTLKWVDLVPVLSYLLLKGHCRYCGVKISPRYPIVEAACGAMAAFCFGMYSLSPKMLISFSVLIILLAVTLIDQSTMTIPDPLVVALIPFAVCAAWVWRDISLAERIIGFFIVSLPMLLIAIAVSGAFGGGDIKLIAVCGFLLGWKSILAGFFIALLTGGAYAMYLLISGKSKRGAHIAFGPYLCFGIATSMFWGTEFIRFYMDLLI